MGFTCDKPRSSSGRKWPLCETRFDTRYITFRDHVPYTRGLKGTKNQSIKNHAINSEDVTLDMAFSGVVSHLLEVPIVGIVYYA